MYGLPLREQTSTISLAIKPPSCFDQIQLVAAELSSSKNLDDLKTLRDRAEHLRTETIKGELGLEMHNHAAELKLRAERKLGGRLSEMKLRGGDRRSDRKGQVSLKELGIDKNQSARWQQEASVPEELFTDYLARTRAHGQEISSAALLRIAKQIRQGCTGNRLRLPDHRETAEPAWRREPWLTQHAPVQANEIVTEGKNHLKTLSTLLEFLCERADLPPEAGESRACRHYLLEVAIQFDELLDAFIQITQTPEARPEVHV